MIEIDDRYFIIILLLCIGACLHACLCTTCTPGVRGGQKRGVGPLELKSQMGELPCEYWELTPGHLERQPVLFKKPSLSYQRQEISPTLSAAFSPSIVRTLFQTLRHSKGQKLPMSMHGQMHYRKPLAPTANSHVQKTL